MSLEPPVVSEAPRAVVFAPRPVCLVCGLQIRTKGAGVPVGMPAGSVRCPVCNTGYQYDPERGWIRVVQVPNRFLE